MSILKEVLLEATGVRVAAANKGAIRDREDDGGGSIVGYFDLVGVSVSDNPPIESSVQMSVVAHFEKEGGRYVVDGMEVAEVELGSAQAKKLKTTDVAARLEQDKLVMQVVKSKFERWLGDELGTEQEVKDPMDVARFMPGVMDGEEVRSYMKQGRMVIRSKGGQRTVGMPDQGWWVDSSGRKVQP